MNYMTGMGTMTAGLEMVVAGLALRLSHLFGPARVGWSLVCVFAGLALAHGCHALGGSGLGPEGNGSFAWLHLFVAILLLVSVAHVGTVLRAQEQARPGKGVRRETGVLVEEPYVSGLLYMCARCKSLRDESGAWTPLMEFVAELAGKRLGHGVCPDCAKAWREEWKNRPADVAWLPHP